MIAVINNHFPGLSATFIYREVMELSNRGLDIQTYSIRRPDKNEISPESHDLADQTIYLLPPDNMYVLVSHLFFLFKKPIAYLSTLLKIITSPYPVRPLKNRFRSLLHFGEGVYFAWVLKNNDNVSHIHAHYASHPATLAMVASRLTNIPFSFTAHASDIWMERLFIGEKVKRAKFVVTCTAFGKDYIIQNYDNTHTSKIFTVYHGVNIEKFSRNKNIPLAAGEEYKILHIGRLSEEKAQADLLRACGILKDRGLRFTCSIVGDGPLRKMLESQIEEMDLEDCVRLEGRVFQDQIRNYYQEADVFVLTSIRENLPNVLLESMAMELPVVATRIAAVPELIVDGQNGILFEPGDVKALANVLMELAQNPVKARELSQRGLHTVRSSFNESNSIRMLEEIYRNHGIDS